MRQEYSAIASTSNSNLAVPPSPSPGRPRSPDSIASASDYAERGSPGSPMLCRSPSPSPYMVSPTVAACACRADRRGVQNSLSDKVGRVFY